MSSNDVIVLNSVIEQKRTQTASTLSDADYFELFSFEQCMKHFDLAYDELISGKIGAGGDGGIDGFFVLINDELLVEEPEAETIKRNPRVDLFIIQAKRSESFAETAIDRVIVTIDDIFDLSKDLANYRSVYNEDLIEKAEMFRNTYLKLASRHPQLKINFSYVSKGDVIGIHPNVKNRTEILTDALQRHFPEAILEVQFLGARELLDLSRREKSFTIQLRFLENYISRCEGNKNYVENYIVLSRLADYYKFTTDEDGNLRRYLFESNVRDFQPDVEVNRSIRDTLEAEDDNLDFWFLNNGITILASHAYVAGKTITLDDVQVVNGLQTTTTVYNHLSDTTSEDDRAILVRIIVTEDSEARDRIIKATNSQTPIPPASLRATDRIQRNIEDYFLQHGWFYDRRKNYYKNLGKMVEKIVSIPYLAQAVMAIVLREPDNSRARPSSLIKRNHEYDRVFNESLNLSVYLLCAKIMKRIDGFIRNESLNIPLQEKSNLRFHLAMLLMIRFFGRKDYNSADIEALKEDPFVDNDLTKVLSELVDLARSYASTKGLTLERIAKSRDFVDFVFDTITRSYGEPESEMLLSS